MERLFALSKEGQVSGRITCTENNYGRGMVQIRSIGIPIKSYRELNDGTGGDVSLAVNGRLGRRIACVLDNKGWTMEILDMEGENADTDAE